MSCGEINFLEGGTIKSADILSSSILNSNVQNSTIDGASVTNLVDIDDASVQKIVDAIAKLPKDKLKALADALRDEFIITPVPAPAATESSATPTTIVGSREQTLGTPEVWAEYGEYAIPLYKRS